MRVFPLAWLCCLLVIFLTGCSPDYESYAEHRVAYAQKNQGAIEIVAVDGDDNEGYLDGIILAVNEINQQPEKLLGREIKLHIEQETGSFEDSKQVINRVISNPHITAVLGHRKSAIAIPASAIYERSQLIFMPPASTDTKLTGHGFQYVFRMFPSNTVMAAQLASAAKTLGYKDIVVLYSRDDLSRELAFLFEDAAVKRGMKLIHRASFFADNESYHNLISQFGGKTFDAVFIASSGKPAGHMVRQLREMGIMQPVMGRHSLNSPDYISAAGSAAENTIAPNVFPHEQQTPDSLKFIKSYQAVYHSEPNYNAAQGYDSVMLLASAIRRANSTLPSQLATTLHYLPANIGVTGLHAFDTAGDLQGKIYKFEARQAGEWQLLPALHVPYLLERFEQGHAKWQPEHRTTRFSEVFSQRMAKDDHDAYLLDLAQDILQFKHLGIIYENTEDGRRAASYDVLRQLAERKNINLMGCEVAFSILDRVETERALAACYGKLSLQADALFVPNYRGISQDLIERLNRSLAFYRIPAISLEKPKADTSITLILNSRSDVNQTTMAAYSGLLRNQKIHEFAEHLRGLPDISINLSSLQSYGLPDKPILELAPDSYLHFTDEFLQLGGKP